MSVCNILVSFSVRECSVLIQVGFRSLIKSEPLECLDEQHFSSKKDFFKGTGKRRKLQDSPNKITIKKNLKTELHMRALAKHRKGLLWTQIHTI